MSEVTTSKTRSTPNRYTVHTDITVTIKTYRDTQARRRNTHDALLRLPVGT